MGHQQPQPEALGRADYEANQENWEAVVSENDTKPEVELKPCPFCGMSPEPFDYVDEDGVYGLCCDNRACFPAPGVLASSPEEAAERWNYRGPEDLGNITIHHIGPRLKTKLAAAHAAAAIPPMTYRPATCVPETWPKGDRSDD